MQVNHFFLVKSVSLVNSAGIMGNVKPLGLCNAPVHLDTHTLPVFKSLVLNLV